MKIERLVTESNAIFHSLNADKILKEEKQILGSDAVVLDSDRQNQNKYQAQNEEEPAKKENEDPNADNLNQGKETALPGIKKLNIVA